MRLLASGQPARYAASGTTFECRKKRSSRVNRRRRRLASIERRTMPSISAGGGFPKLHLLVTRTWLGRCPENASPTTSSALPSPYRGARSSRVIPASTAAWTVATHSSNVVAPHSIPRPPPPSVSDETGDKPPNARVCMSTLPASASSVRPVHRPRGVVTRSAMLKSHVIPQLHRVDDSCCVSEGTTECARDLHLAPG